MTLRCPACLADIPINEPFDLIDATLGTDEPEVTCPACQHPYFLEVDEHEDGPHFTLYKERPGDELFPPSDQEDASA